MNRLAAAVASLAAALAACTGDDRPSPSDSCDGVVCNSPPSADCSDGFTLRRYATTGTCAGGQCDYSPSDVSCQWGCDPEARACRICPDPCEPGATLCRFGEVRTCAPDVDGCLRWTPAKTCAEGFCEDASECGTCAHGCPAENATRCVDGRLERCLLDTHGCRYWGAPTICADGFCLNATACGTCSHACSAGQAQCNAGQVRSCTADTNGCRRWGAWQACATGVCLDATECTTCVGQLCDGEGATSCNAGKIRACARDTAGCLRWSTATSCASGFCANGTSCGSCNHACPGGGVVECQGGRVRRCSPDINGCLAWSAWSDCPSGWCADATQCGSCANPCSGNETQCQGGDLRRCTTDTHGCSVWDGWTDCASGFCGTTTTCGTCNHACPTAGVGECSSARTRTCLEDTNRCRAWSDWTSCPSGFCDANGLVCGTCSHGCDAGASECADGKLRTCQADAFGCRSWGSWQDCTSGFCASQTACGTCSHACAADQTQCQNGQIRTCTTDSHGCRVWGSWSACPSGSFCASQTACGVCTHACSDGQTECASGRWRDCTTDTGGCRVWDAWTDCAEGTCASQTACGEPPAPDLTVTAQTMELCGEQRYGAVVLQGGAKLVCSTCDLTIRANTISIDPASSIDLSGCSASSSGESLRICTGACGCWAGYSGAGGGGNATAGGSTLGSPYASKDYNCNGSCVQSSCGGAVGGGARGAQASLVGTQGGRGGTGCTYVSTYSGCTSSDWRDGGKGGGSVRLLARNSVSVLGQVLAKGANGVDGAGGSGGGAGGTVVVAAPSLQISGQIKADPGAGGTGTKPYLGSQNANGGNGGNGWVKLLHGPTYSNTGTVTGATAGNGLLVGWMPPLAITSSTHPDAALVYNDTFAQFAAAWTAPFAADGYWYRLTRDAAPAPHPGPAGSLYAYTASSSLAFPASMFTSVGTWYLDILSESGGTKGPVANRFALVVNATPHTLASSTHASQTTWYALPAPPATPAISMTWTSPSGASADSFRAFYYRLDRASTLAPTNAKTEWTRTTNTGLTLTTDAAGQPIGAWVYYFHLVAEDTKGNLTKAAAHYRIQSGPEPAKTTFFGYVKLADNTPVAGAVVRLEPFGLEQTTDAAGYFYFGSNTTYVGSYVLTVTKAGYATLTRPQEIAATGTSPLNLTLTP